MKVAHNDRAAGLAIVGRMFLNAILVGRKSVAKSQCAVCLAVNAGFGVVSVKFCFSAITLLADALDYVGGRVSHYTL